jgi:hypothetical protein
MLRGSWTHACARVTVGLVVAFALGASSVRDAPAADAPAPTPAQQPPVATSSATPSSAATPSTAPSPADAPADAPPPSLPPPAAAPPSTVPSSPTATELDGPAPRTTAGTGGSTQSGLAGCAVWTDRCVICQRDSGVVACSNIGIACQPQPMVCLRPEAAPEKKPEH